MSRKRRLLQGGGFIESILKRELPLENEKETIEIQILVDVLKQTALLRFQHTEFITWDAIIHALSANQNVPIAPINDQPPMVIAWMDRTTMERGLASNIPLPAMAFALATVKAEAEFHRNMGRMRVHEQRQMQQMADQALRNKIIGG